MLICALSASVRLIGMPASLRRRRSNVSRSRVMVAGRSSPDRRTSIGPSNRVKNGKVRPLSSRNVRSMKSHVISRFDRTGRRGRSVAKTLTAGTSTAARLVTEFVLVEAQELRANKPANTIDRIQVTPRNITTTMGEMVLDCGNSGVRARSWRGICAKLSAFLGGPACDALRRVK